MCLTLYSIHIVLEYRNGRFLIWQIKNYFIEYADNVSKCDTCQYRDYWLSFLSKWSFIQILLIPESASFMVYSNICSICQIQSSDSCGTYIKTAWYRRKHVSGIDGWDNTCKVEVRIIRIMSSWSSLYQFTCMNVCIICIDY